LHALESLQVESVSDSNDSKLAQGNAAIAAEFIVAGLAPAPIDLESGTVARPCIIELTDHALGRWNEQDYTRNDFAWAG
jgi:hypothetical protein